MYESKTLPTKVDGEIVDMEVPDSTYRKVIAKRKQSIKKTSKMKREISRFYTQEYEQCENCLMTIGPACFCDRRDTITSTREEVDVGAKVKEPEQRRKKFMDMRKLWQQFDKCSGLVQSKLAIWKLITSGRMTQDDLLEITRKADFLEGKTKTKVFISAIAKMGEYLKGFSKKYLYEMFKAFKNEECTERQLKQRLGYYLKKAQESGILTKKYQRSASVYKHKIFWINTPTTKIKGTEEWSK